MKILAFIFLAMFTSTTFASEEVNIFCSATGTSVEMELAISLSEDGKTASGSFIFDENKDSRNILDYFSSQKNENNVFTVVNNDKYSIVTTNVGPNVWTALVTFASGVSIQLSCD